MSSIEVVYSMSLEIDSELYFKQVFYFNVRLLQL